MVEPTPGNSSFDDRLRATFSAEHADMERRLLAQDQASTRVRNFKWIPFAVAAAVVALAGFFFIGSRGNDQAVELDVAAQTAQQQTAQPSPGTGEPLPQDTPTAVADVLFFPYQTGVKYCNNYNSDRIFVDGPPEGTPVLAEPEASGTIGITRRLAPGDVVQLIGGCTAGTTSVGVIEWYEIASVSGENTEWIRSDYLLTGDEYERRANPGATVPPPLNGCGEALVVFPFRFVWDITADDPDGGLVAHTQVGIDAPRTRLIERDEVVALTGQCELSSTGSKWRELHALDGSQDWVSGRYLREPEGACLDFTSPTPLPGLAVADGDQVAFAPVSAQRYDMYPADRVTFRSGCGPTPDAMPCPVFGPLFVWDIAIDDEDGGLRTHTLADVDSPVVRTLPFDMADVNATGLCKQSSSGSLWWQLDGPEGVDWASGNFLAHPKLACLAGSAVTNSPEEPFFHTVAAGDTLGRMAQLYNVPLDFILEANPDLNIDAIVAGQLVRIPGAVTTEQIATPGAGWAVSQGNRTAYAPQGESTWTWFPSDSIVDGNCVLGGPDTLALLPCARATGETSTALEAGTVDSAADHVHDIRSESNSVCTRLIVEFGQKPGDADIASSLLPPLVVHRGLQTITVSPTTRQWQTSFDDPKWLKYGDGIGLLAVSSDYTFSVEFMHAEMESHVRFMSDPARIIIDLFPIANGAAATAFGDNFVLRQPIQQDLTGPGIPVDNDIIVAGFGRPFEAAGLYRIWAVPDGTDPHSFLADPPAPMIEEFFATTGWAEAWGEFYVDLPELRPGTYIAVFGELPPIQDLGYYGTGQLFRIAAPDSAADAVYPEAVLLPEVHLAPEG